MSLFRFPTKRSDNTKTTFEIELLYPADNHPPRSNPIKSKRPRIFESDHLKERQTVVKWVKAKIYGLGKAYCFMYFIYFYFIFILSILYFIYHNR